MSNQAQHTPGPWDIVETPASREVDYNGEHLIVLPANNVVLARLEHYAPAERRANARLIAAAPDLLDALKAAEKYVANSLERHREAGRSACVAEVTDKLAAVRAAIAKAEGR